MGTGAGPGWDRGLCLAWGASQGRASSGVGVESPPAPEAQRKERRTEPSLMHVVEAAAWQGHPRQIHLTHDPSQPSIQTPLEMSTSRSTASSGPMSSPPPLSGLLSPPVWALCTRHLYCGCFLRKSATQTCDCPCSLSLAWLPLPHMMPKPLGVALRAHLVGCRVLSAPVWPSVNLFTHLCASLDRGSQNINLPLSVALVANDVLGL